MFQRMIQKGLAAEWYQMVFLCDYLQQSPRKPPKSLASRDEWDKKIIIFEENFGSNQVFITQNTKYM